MRKSRKSNINNNFEHQDTFAQDSPLDWNSAAADSWNNEFGADFEDDFQSQTSSAPDSSRRLRFSHIFISLLLIILIASNIVASRVVNNALTWFVLAFSFGALLVLSFFALRFFYRLGYKKISSFLFLPVFVACSFFGANVVSVINDPMINESLLSELPSKPQYVFHISGKNNQMVQAFDESERFVAPSEMWESWFSKAAVAIEDSRFERRFEGVIDARAVLRATIKNLWKWNTEEGASGIEIQTAKLLTGHYKTKSYLQKAGQGLIALRLDQRFPFPEEKFCLYGNIVDLVSGKRGVGAAASDLFGISDLRQLSISQSAVLGAMLKNSSIWNPRKNIEKTRQRRDLVLGKMRELEFISEEQYKAALKEEIKLVPRIKPNELFIRAAVNLHNLERERTR